MPEQYVATDKRTGLEVAVTGAFPDHPQDRIRIARTANLFCRLTSTILAMEHESDRREAFVAVETQMELADAHVHFFSPAFFNAMSEQKHSNNVEFEWLDALPAPGPRSGGRVP